MVTDVGGQFEWVDEPSTGFIAEASARSLGGALDEPGRPGTAGNPSVSVLITSLHPRSTRIRTKPSSRCCLRPRPPRLAIPSRSIRRYRPGEIPQLGGTAISRGLSLSHRRTISSWMEFNLSGSHGGAARQAGASCRPREDSVPPRTPPVARLGGNVLASP